jgi:hypothetical protein
MLDDQGYRHTKNGGGDDHRGHLELKQNVREQMNLDRTELKVGGDHVDHPGGNDHASDNLGTLQESRQIRASSPRSCPLWHRLSNLPAQAALGKLA